MNQIKPILPCPSIKEQVSFYESLGFQCTYTSNRPHPYAIVKFGELEIHVYGSKKTIPAENSQMCYVEVDDVHAVYETFTSGLKRNTGKIPRSGIPRISKLKDLADDRRFIITDLGGNTLFVGTPNSKVDEPSFLRTMEHADYAKHFAILFDLMYSKEDSHSALLMLEKFFPADVAALPVNELDLAKLLLVVLDIHLHLDLTIPQGVEDKLQELLRGCDRNDARWNKIIRQYKDITGGE